MQYFPRILLLYFSSSWLLVWKLLGQSDTSTNLLRARDADWSDYSLLALFGGKHSQSEQCYGKLDARTNNEFISHFFFSLKIKCCRDSNQKCSMMNKAMHNLKPWKLKYGLLNCRSKRYQAKLYTAFKGKFTTGSRSHNESHPLKNLFVCLFVFIWL